MNNIINIINISIKHNKKGFLIKNNKKNKNIIKCFLSINIIKYFIIKNEYIFAYINYINNKPVFKNIINLYKKGNLKTIKFNTLKKINEKYNWILLISTNKGFLNNFEAVKNKVGGLLLVKIWN